MGGEEDNLGRGGMGSPVGRGNLADCFVCCCCCCSSWIFANDIFAASSLRHVGVVGGLQGIAAAGLGGEEGVPDMPTTEVCFDRSTDSDEGREGNEGLRTRWAASASASDDMMLLKSRGLTLRDTRNLSQLYKYAAVA